LRYKGVMPNPVRHENCGVNWKGELPEKYFSRLPILNLRAVHNPV
jgi:hypothetical protein